MKCYNGCPDPTLRVVISDSFKVDSDLAFFGAKAVYFPMEAQWAVFKGSQQITGFHNDKREAADNAIAIIKGGAK